MSGILAIIPARGGSRRIPRKNVLPVGGLPLIAHSVRHALASRLVTEVVVSTDDDEIASITSRLGAAICRRPAELASDTATSESALLHVLDERRGRGLADPELIVFLQCTSPVRRAHDIDRAIETLRAKNADTLFSTCDNKRLIWAEAPDGALAALTYDYRNRRREQDMAKQHYENGSIFVIKPEVLRRDNNRMGGRIAVYEMEMWTSFQVDDQADLALVDWILRRPEFAAPPVWSERVDLVVFDFDGVMTDNRVLVSQTGEEAVACHRGDGLGVDLLKKAGVPMMILSTEVNPVVATRAAKLGIEVEHGVGDKAARLAEILARRGIDPVRVVYLGNDVNDAGCLRQVGMPVVVADAHPSVLSLARLVLSRSGGHGAVRELADLILARVH